MGKKTRAAGAAYRAKYPAEDCVLRYGGGKGLLIKVLPDLIVFLHHEGGIYVSTNQFLALGLDLMDIVDIHEGKFGWYLADPISGACSYAGDNWEQVANAFVNAGVAYFCDIHGRPV